MHIQTAGGVSRVLGILAITASLMAGVIAGAGEARPAAAQPAAGPAGEFVGRVAGTDAFIAVVTDGSRVFGFVCDGTDDGVSVWGWFRGAIADGRTVVTDATGQTLAIELGDAGGAGSVTLADGVTRDVQVEPATGDAGLFRLEQMVGNASVLGGWIVLNDGDLRGQTQIRPIMPSPMSLPRFAGTGSFNVQTGTASITDGTSNTLVMPPRITSGIIAVLIG